MAVERLFRFFEPSKYTLELDIDKEKFRFNGRVKINGIKKTRHQIIKLHSKGLKIKKVVVNGEPSDFNYVNSDNLSIVTQQKINNNISIEITYSGKITRSMHGIYPCFTSSNNVILATQLESHHAREVFPSIDEPEAKAVFQLTIISEAEPAILSNTPIISQEKINHRLRTTFAETPKMSSYLLAFVIGNLHSVSTKTSNGTIINVWSSPDHNKNDLKFSLDIAKRSTEFFNDYFQVPYPLTKCDHVALPDFSSGAMENWGLITYREICLIANEKNTSQSLKEYIATVISHEISHQWFGNLVTMQWWDDLWLNESFATLMEYIAVDYLFPEWDIMLSFANQEGLAATRRDILPGVQPVSSEVKHPDEISTLFDPSIVYAKGARLMLMVYNLVGEKSFRKGLNDYFLNFAYANARGEDLWKSLSKYSEIDIARIMLSWLVNPGIPLLTVKEVKDKSYVYQSKFNSKSKILWKIPLFANQKINYEILENRDATITSMKNNELIFNTKGGHYLVHYKDKNKIEYISALIAKKKLSPTQRLLFLNNLSLQAKIGTISIVEILQLLKSFSKENSAPVWSVISTIIAETKKLIEDDIQLENKLKEFVWDLIEPQYQKLGWITKKNDSPNTIKQREVILGLSIYSEKIEAINSAKKMYFKYKDIRSIPSNIRDLVLSTAVKFDESGQLFDNMKERYPNEKNPEIQSDIANALTSSRDLEKLKNILNELKNDKWVKAQSVDSFFIHLLINKKSRRSSWVWLTKNWHWIEKTFASDKSFDNYPRYCASVLIGDEWLTKYKEFFDPLMEIPSLKRNILIGQADIVTKNSWYKRDHEKIREWLSK